jgi:hypothetical protein
VDYREVPFLQWFAPLADSSALQYVGVVKLTERLLAGVDVQTI